MCKVLLWEALCKNRHAITYFSKQSCKKLQNASTYVQELHAMTIAVKKWRHYLLGDKLIIETNQKILRELLNQTVQTTKQHYYLSKLLSYSYEIIYKPSKQL